MSKEGILSTQTVVWKYALESIESPRLLDLTPASPSAITRTGKDHFGTYVLDTFNASLFHVLVQKKILSRTDTPLTFVNFCFCGHFN